MCLKSLEVGVARGFSKEDQYIKGIFTLAAKRLTEYLSVLPGNVSFPATECSREFESLGATKSRRNG